MKFGGTSVGSAESMLRVKSIVEKQTEPVIVVVSALGGITDKLIKTSQMAVEGDALYQKSFEEIKQRHDEMIDAVIPAGEKRNELQTKVNGLLEELRSIYQGVYLIRDLSSKIQAAIVSYGERISSQIVAHILCFHPITSLSTITFCPHFLFHHYLYYYFLFLSIDLPIAKYHVL